LRREVESRRTWDEFWEKQVTSEELIPRLIRWGRSYWSCIYTNFIKKHCVGPSVLEAGSGSAESTFRLANENKHVTEVTVLDYSRRSMALARRNAQIYGVETDFIVGDIHLMPFKPSSFDFVWNMGVLEHFEDPISILKEMKRVAKKGGKMAAIMPFKYAPLVYLSKLLKPFSKITKGYEKFQTWEETKQFWSHEQLRQKFEEVGLKRVKVQLLLKSFLVDVAIVGEKDFN